MPVATTVSVEVESDDTVIYPADGPNVDRVGAQNLLSHGSTLYLNTGTTEPGLLVSETGGASWRSQPIELSHLPPPPEGETDEEEEADQSVSRVALFCPNRVRGSWFVVDRRRLCTGTGSAD